MKSKNIIWIVIGLVAAVVIGWNLVRPAGGTGIRNVDVAGVKEAITQGAQLIDVRSAGEFQLGHIPGAVNVPVETVQAQAAGWDKSKLYVVYCASGARSASAVDVMKGMGFTNIRHFNAGLQAWPDALEKGDVSSSQTIQTSGKPVFLEFYTDS